MVVATRGNQGSVRADGDARTQPSWAATVRIGYGASAVAGHAINLPSCRRRKVSCRPSSEPGRRPSIVAGEATGLVLAGRHQVPALQILSSSDRQKHIGPRDRTGKQSAACRASFLGDLTVFSGCAFSPSPT